MRIVALARVPAARPNLVPFLGLFLILIPLLAVLETTAREGWTGELPGDFRLPAAYSPGPCWGHERDPRQIVLYVLRDGTFFICGRRISDQELRDALRTEARRDRDSEGYSNVPVLIKADEQVDYQHVRKVLRICSELRVWRVSFAVRWPDELLWTGLPRDDAGFAPKERP